MRRIGRLVPLRAGGPTARQASLRLLVASWSLQFVQEVYHVPVTRVVTRTFSAAGGEKGDTSLVIRVPSMGDSITDGTVASIAAPVGSVVRTDDVLVSIETDKVTVDIRAPVGGIVAKYFAAVGDVIEVGAHLVVLETAPEAVSAAGAVVTPPAVAASPPPPPPSVGISSPQDSERAVPPAPPQPAAPQPSTVHTGQRVPLIRFRHRKRVALGVDEAKEARGMEEAPKASASAPQPVGSRPAVATPSVFADAESYMSYMLRKYPSTGTDDLPPWYGRPAMSDEEMEAINSGAGN